MDNPRLTAVMPEAHNNTDVCARLAAIEEQLHAIVKRLDELTCLVTTLDSCMIELPPARSSGGPTIRK